MNDDELKALQKTLRRLVAQETDADVEQNRKALTVAMSGVQAALAEVLALSEKVLGSDGNAIGEAAEHIARAISLIEFTAPEMEFKPTINVAAPDMRDVKIAPVFNVAAPPPAVNNIVVKPADVVMNTDRGEVTMSFTFKYEGAFLTGGTATINRSDAA